MKILKSVCFCAAVLLALSSCSKDEGGSKSIVLTFGSHQSGLPTTGIVQSMAKDFEAETGIKIDIQVSPDGQWRDLIKLKLDSGEATDIFCIDTPVNLASSLHVEQYCVPLTDEEWVSRMDPNVIPAVSVGDDVYGITFAGKKMYMYIYNKDLFAKAGASIPTNYEELKETCEKLLAIGVTPIYEGTTNSWHQVLPLFETAGLYLEKDPDLYEKLNANEIDLDDIPDLLEIIRELKECAELGYFGEDYLSNSVSSAKLAFAEEKAAMFISETAWIQEVKSDFPEFDTSKAGIFVMPWGGNQVIGVNPASNAYFINKDCKHIQEAKSFFGYIAQHDKLVERFEGETRLSELCWPEIEGRYSEEHQAFLDSYPKAPVVQIAVNYIDSQWMDIGQDLEAMFAGGLTPEGVLEAMMKRRTEQALLQRDPGWQ